MPLVCVDVVVHFINRESERHAFLTNTAAARFISEYTLVPIERERRAINHEHASTLSSDHASYIPSERPFYDTIICKPISEMPRPISNLDLDRAWSRLVAIESHDTSSRYGILGDNNISNPQARRREPYNGFMGGYGPRINPDIDINRYNATYEEHVRGTYYDLMQLLENTETQSIEETENSVSRASALLLDCLTPDETAEYKNFGTVTIKTEEGLFRVNVPRNTENPFSTPNKNVLFNDVRCCLVLGGVYPSVDHAVMQILMIKANPGRFLREANLQPRGYV